MPISTNLLGLAFSFGITLVCALIANNKVLMSNSSFVEVTLSIGLENENHWRQSIPNCKVIHIPVVTSSNNAGIPIGSKLFSIANSSSQFFNLKALGKIRMAMNK